MTHVTNNCMNIYHACCYYFKRVLLSCLRQRSTESTNAHTHTPIVIESSLELASSITEFANSNPKGPFPLDHSIG